MGEEEVRTLRIGKRMLNDYHLRAHLNMTTDSTLETSEMESSAALDQMRRRRSAKKNGEYTQLLFEEYEKNLQEHREHEAYRDRVANGTEKVFGRVQMLELEEAEKKARKNAKASKKENVMPSGSFTVEKAVPQLEDHSFAVPMIKGRAGMSASTPNRLDSSLRPLKNLNISEVASSSIVGGQISYNVPKNNTYVLQNDQEVAATSIKEGTYTLEKSTTDGTFIVAKEGDVSGGMFALSNVSKNEEKKRSRTNASSLMDSLLEPEQSPGYKFFSGPSLKKFNATTTPTRNVTKASLRNKRVSEVENVSSVGDMSTECFEKTRACGANQSSIFNNTGKMFDISEDTSMVPVIPDKEPEKTVNTEPGPPTRASTRTTSTSMTPAVLKANKKADRRTIATATTPSNAEPHYMTPTKSWASKSVTKNCKTPNNLDLVEEKTNTIFEPEVEEEMETAVAQVEEEMELAVAQVVEAAARVSIGDDDIGADAYHDLPVDDEEPKPVEDSVFSLNTPVRSDRRKTLERLKWDVETTVNDPTLIRPVDEDEDEEDEDDEGTSRPKAQKKQKASAVLIKRKIIKPATPVNGLRRSKRTRVRTVRGWLGERAVYENSPSSGLRRLVGVNDVELHDPRYVKNMNANMVVCVERERAQQARRQRQREERRQARKTKASDRRKELDRRHRKGQDLDKSRFDIVTSSSSEDEQE